MTYKITTGMCSCGSLDFKHTCPYREKHEQDIETLCDCCEACIEACANEC
jgi:hypothetical protein